jgi:hypothetical protein
MTGQDLLDAMELLNQELQLQSAEEDVVRGLTALNIAQDYFEALAAQEGHMKLDSTMTVTSAANTETTSFPTGFLRLDSIWKLDSNSKPEYELTDVQAVGGHAASRTWPLNLLPMGAAGTPEGYYTNGRSIYWAPLPDNTYTFRVYGFKTADAITAAGTFAYDDHLRLPLASFAVRLFKLGVGDDAGDLTSLAKETFGNALATMAGFNRTGASALSYTRSHST